MRWRRHARACRASTSFQQIGEQDVDGRDKPGHDVIMGTKEIMGRQEILGRKEA